MPAAAVIPAPIAYIKVVAVKKLVVEYLSGGLGLVARLVLRPLLFPSGKPRCPSLDVLAIQNFYFEKIRVFKAGICLNTLAWNNRTGPQLCFCWFSEPR